MGCHFFSFPSSAARWNHTTCPVEGIRYSCRRRNHIRSMLAPLMTGGFRPARFLLLGVLVLASCRTVEPPPPPPEPAPVAEKKKPAPLYEWKGDGLSGPLAIRINTNHQKAYLTKGGKDAGWTYVATGLHNYPTPVGSFRIQEKTVDKRSNLWGKIYNSKGRVVVSDARAGRDKVPSGGRFEGSSMRYWMRLTGDGIGMHVGRIPRPGNRASHGCIRLPAGIAPTIFRHAVIGTPVKIEGSGPKWKPMPAPKKTTTDPAPAPSTETAPTEPAPPPAPLPTEPTPAGESPTPAPSPAPESGPPPAPPTEPVPTGSPAGG